MPVTWTRHGQAAHAALRERVSAAKRADPMAPVTVLVPTDISGVIVRRSLARGVAGHQGVVGLTVLTIERLAERLAAPRLVGSGRRPAIGPALAAAWRTALDDDAGVFEPVAEHRATVHALVEAHRELRQLDSHALDAIAQNGEQISADLIRLHRRVTDILADGWYDVTDLRTVATSALRENPRRIDELGATILFLPQEPTNDAIAFLHTLAASTDLHVIAALTGEPKADAAVRELIERLSLDDAEHAAGTDTVDSRDINMVDGANRIIHASDADDEVRCVVRDLVGKLTHTPPHRVAILYGTAQPYARLLAEHLHAAGITTNGTGVRPTIERTFARVLLDFLYLPDHDWRRDDVMRLIASGPIRRPDSSRVPSSRWDRLSRAAGVVGGDDWHTRLTSFAAHERNSAERERESDAPSAGLINRRQRNADAADELRAFVTSLKSRIATGAALTTWPELSAWANDTFRALVGDPDEEPWLPEDEARAADTVRRILSGLAGLGAIEQTADLTALRLTLELELADDRPRQGSHGTGVLVGPLAAAIGLDADVVYVLGLAEDVTPARVRDDALLPDRVRERTGGQLTPLRSRIDRQHRHLLAAFAAPECIASFPRGDLRHSSHRLPSRWLLPSLRELSNTPQLNATSWNNADGDWLVASPSYVASLSRTTTLTTHQEWRTRAAIAARAAGRDIVRLLNDDTLADALALVRARRSKQLTRFDGDLTGHDVPDITAPRSVVSPTALEDWAACPHGYFVRRLLRVEPLETPEELVKISPIDVGNLVHYALDRFFTEQAKTGTVPPADQPWTAEQRATLERVAGEVADEFEHRGLTGHPLLWRQERARIMSDLQRLLDDDDKLRAETGRRQVRSELDFGMNRTDAVEVDLPDGRTLRFRGSADRVDRAGDAIVVVDYKTGGRSRYQGLGEDDPTRNGTKLQLPVYAHAARAMLNAPDAEVAAEYWFIRGDLRIRIDLPLTDTVRRVHADALAVIADGITSGLFPHRPPKDDGWAGFIECEYCDPDGMGTKDHQVQWARKRSDPRLAAYVRLVEPDRPVEEVTS